MKIGNLQEKIKAMWHENDTVGNSIIEKIVNSNFYMQEIHNVLKINMWLYSLGYKVLSDKYHLILSFTGYKMFF